MNRNSDKVKKIKGATKAENMKSKVIRYIVNEELNADLADDSNIDRIIDVYYDYLVALRVAGFAGCIPMHLLPPFRLGVVAWVRQAISWQPRLLGSRVNRPSVTSQDSEPAGTLPPFQAGLPT